MTISRISRRSRLEASLAQNEYSGLEGQKTPTKEKYLQLPLYKFEL